MIPPFPGSNPGAEAIARCAATTQAERRELVDAVLGARDAIAAALDATKRS